MLSAISHEFLTTLQLLMLRSPMQSGVCLCVYVYVFVFVFVCVLVFQCLCLFVYPRMCLVSLFISRFCFVLCMLTS